MVVLVTAISFSYKVIIYSTFLFSLLSHRNVKGAMALSQTEDFIPPKIVSLADSELAYRPGEPVTISCKATGQPYPNYHWEKNGVRLEVDGVSLKLPFLPRNGSLQIDQPDEQHDGVYQCFSTNIYGTAVSIKTLLKMAVLEPFVSKAVITLKPRIGDALVLTCHPPKGYPSPTVYWGESAAKTRPIELSNRVSLDYEGNMYFSNVNETDGRKGKKYVCLAVNPKIRSQVEGDDHVLIPQASDQSLVAPTLMWYSGQRTVALKGHEARIKCIFAGLPTPKVTLRRSDGKSNSKIISPDEYYGQELLIRNLDVDDAGEYMCYGSNDAGQSDITKINLIVESKPYWINNKPPQSLHVGEEEEANFDCLTDGIPFPQISWMINGVPVSDLSEDSRRLVTVSSLRLFNVSINDNMVVQCNASNKHGSILSNAYLIVRAEAPQFIVMPESVTRVSEGNQVTLNCAGSGAPKPFVSWFKGNSTAALQSSDLISIFPSGQLEIRDIDLEDEDTYHCQLSNKYGVLQSSGNLKVYKKISVNMPMTNISVRAGERVTFRCDVTADRYDVIDVDWLRNNQPVDYEHSGNQYRKNPQDNSLTVLSSRVADTGRYTCKARTDLDEAEYTGQLVVKDRPDPPEDVHFSSCTNNVTVLSWRSGSSNNDDIFEHIVTFNNSLDQTIVKYTAKFDEYSVNITLEPYRNYTFYVSSVNEIGSSDSAESPQHVCSTPAMRPLVHPTQVCSQQGTSSQLIVIWKPIERSQVNGPGFHYLVTYQRGNVSDAVPETRQVIGWEERRLVIEDQEPFSPYTVYVKSVNEMGEALDSESVKKRTMFSGEASPLVKVENFQVIADTLNSSGVEFMWDPVSQDPSVIRGYFRGYQIQYWKAHDPENKRSIDIIEKSIPNLCPLVENEVKDENLRHRRDVMSRDKVRVYVTDLWPLTRISAGVVVLNGAHSGQLSDVIVFDTPPAPPAAVADLTAKERGSFHLQLQWSAPGDPAKSITGYRITYRTVSSSGKVNPEERAVYVVNTHIRLNELDPSTIYLISVCAETDFGCGETLDVKERTLDESAPDKPEIDKILTDETLTNANVSWLRVPSGVKSVNPATEFYVEYRKTDSDDWVRSSKENERNWLNITNLVLNSTYTMRAVAANWKHESRSEEKDLVVQLLTELPTESPVLVQSASSYVWIVIVLILLLLIILIIVFVYVAYQRHGATYPVLAKEREKEKDPKLQDEAPFAEFTAPSRPMLTHSQASLISAKSGSDADSLLGEYEESEETKFNEDGSFIGQYGGKRDVESGVIDTNGSVPMPHTEQPDPNTVV